MQTENTPLALSRVSRSGWLLFALYLLALFCAAVVFPFTLLGLIPLAAAGVLSLMLGRNIKRTFSVSAPLWRCLCAGWIVSGLGLFALSPRGGLEFGALVLSFYLFFFLPLVVPVLGLFIGGTLQLLILFSGNVRAIFGIALPVALACALCWLLFYAKRSMLTYEELFVVTFDAEGSFAGEQTLARSHRWMAHFSTAYTNFDSAHDVAASEGKTLWVLTNSHDADRAGAPPSTLRKYDLEELTAATFSVTVDKSFARNVRALTPTADGGIVLMASHGSTRDIFRGEGAWQIQRFDGTGAAAESSPTALQLEGNGRLFAPVISRQGSVYALYLTDPVSETPGAFSGELHLKRFADPSSPGWAVYLGTIRSTAEGAPRLIITGDEDIVVVRQTRDELKISTYRPDGGAASETSSPAAMPVPLIERANGDRHQNPQANGTFLASIEDEDSIRALSLQWLKPDGTVDRDFAYRIDPARCNGCTNIFTNSFATAVATSRFAFIAGEAEQTDRLYHQVGRDWWLARIDLAARGGIGFSNTRHEGFERFVHLGIAGGERPFVVARRQGLGWSSDSLLSRLLTTIYERLIGAVPFEDPQVASLTTGESPKGTAHVPQTLEGDAFPNPYLSACAPGTRSLRSPLKPNPPDGPNNLRYLSNLNQTLTFFWECPADRPGPHVFEYDCCNCDQREPERERHGFFQLNKTEFTLKVAPGREYLWHVSCGNSFAPISHDNLALLGRAGQIYHYRYYDFPKDRVPEPMPTQWGGVTPDDELDERVRRYQEKLRRANRN